MTKKVTFTPPEGAVPEGTGVGDDFDLVCTFRLEAGATVCLTQMGDHKMAGYDERETQTKAPTPYHAEAKAMTSAAPAGANPSYA